MRETVNPTEEVYVKKLWAFAACEKKKLGNSLVAIYSSATKITSDTRTQKEHLFAEEIIVTRDR